MKPAWDMLAQRYASSDKIIVADVDCTAAGEPLCEKYGVEGFPTIKYFNPPDDEGEDYEGERDLESLVEFAQQGLGPSCSAATPEQCSEAQKAKLAAVMAMSDESREKQLAELKQELSKVSPAMLRVFPPDRNLAVSPHRWRRTTRRSRRRSRRSTTSRTRRWWHLGRRRSC